MYRHTGDDTGDQESDYRKVEVTWVFIVLCYDEYGVIRSRTDSRYYQKLR